MLHQERLLQQHLAQGTCLLPSVPPARQQKEAIRSPGFAFLTGDDTLPSANRTAFLEAAVHQIINNHRALFIFALMNRLDEQWWGIGHGRWQRGRHHAAPCYLCCKFWLPPTNLIAAFNTGARCRGEIALSTCGTWRNMQILIICIYIVYVYNMYESVNHTSKLSDKQISLPCSGVHDE